MLLLLQICSDGGLVSTSPHVGNDLAISPKIVTPLKLICENTPDQTIMAVLKHPGLVLQKFPDAGFLTH